MDYNTQRTKLIFREYGRNIQKMIDKAVAIEDRDNKNALVNRIIELMGQVNPQLKNVDDFRHKLWDHLFLMSDFKLGINSPYPIPTRESLEPKSVKLPYPQSRIQFKHYGKNVEHLIQKAIEMDDVDKKKAFTKVIANYMKMVYQSWNRDGVSDDLIKNDLAIISKGLLTLDENEMLDRTRQPSRRPSNTGSSGGRSSGGRGGHRGGRSNGYKSHSNNSRRRGGGYRNNGK